MSDTVLVTIISGIITLAGTMITVFSNSVRTRRENKDRLDQIERKLDKHIADNEKESATVCRSRILRFANDVRHGNEFTKDYWDTIMIDVTEYTKYTDDHPDFKNKVCIHAIELLERKYDELLLSNGFVAA